MNNSFATVYCYLAAWHEKEHIRRQELIHQTFVEDAIYVDPLSYAVGYDALNKMMAQFSEQLPGAAFLLTNDIVQQDAIIRFDWKLCAIDGDILIEGSDHVQLSKDGRFQHVIGFYKLTENPEDTFKTAAATFTKYQQKKAKVPIN